MPLLLTAQQAAEYLGLENAAKFKRAVARGEFPKPHCPTARPQMWSRPAIDAALQPPENRAKDETARLDRELGI